MGQINDTTCSEEFEEQNTEVMRKDWHNNESNDKNDENIDNLVSRVQDLYNILWLDA